MKRTLTCASVVLVAMTAAAQARVTRIEINRQEPFAAGQTFGSVGAYERVIGRFHGELDPAQPLNADIVDIDKAPRNARGMVEYSADFYILKPVDLGKGNGALFYEVNNRGGKAALARFNNGARSNDPSTAEHAGNGFLMREGFTVVWNGWMPDAPAGDNALRIEVPAATGAGLIEQTVWDEFLFNNKTTKEGRLTYRATSTDKKDATLLVRNRNSEEPAAVPPEQWEFVDARTIRLLPAGTPFRIGAIYQLIYKAANPPVNGIGFASTRDFVSFLRYAAADDAGTPNPLAAGGRPAIARTLSHGNSQSGRYLRDFIYRPDRACRARLHVVPGRELPVCLRDPDRPAHGQEGRQPRPLLGEPHLSQDRPHPQRHRILAGRGIADHHRRARPQRLDHSGQCAHLPFRLDPARGRRWIHAQWRVRDALQSDRLPSAAARRRGRARPLGQGRNAPAGEPLPAHRGRLAGRQDRARPGSLA